MKDSGITYNKLPVLYGAMTKQEEKSNTGQQKVRKFLKDNLLVILIVISAIIGFVIGILINSSIQNLKQPDRYTAIILIGFPGELFIRMLKMLILPLLFCSLIVGLASIDGTQSGKIGLRAIVYYISTTCLAALLGLMLVSAIQPGSRMSHPTKQSERKQLVRPLDSFMDILRNMFPANIIRACVQTEKTVIKEESEVRILEKAFNISNITTNQINKLLKEKKIKKRTNSSGNMIGYSQHIVVYNRTYKIGDGLITKGNANFLGVIIFALAVGKIVGSMGNEAATFIHFITEFNEIITRLIIIVMWCAPIGIMSLIMAKSAEMEDIGGTFSSLALFIVTVLLGIGIHGLIALPLIFCIATRSNPYVYIQGLTAAMATAFGTDSSAATLPVTFRCLEENLNIDKRITRFILPVGATINMDGTALYEAVSAIFIAQSVGFPLSFGDYISISFTSILASIGAAAIPHAGLVTMLIVLDTVGLPTDMVAVIFSVDWFLDRCRTTINVLGDAFGAGIVQHLSKKDLEETKQEYHAITDDSLEKTKLCNESNTGDNNFTEADNCVMLNQPKVHVSSPTRDSLSEERISRSDDRISRSYERLSRSERSLYTDDNSESDEDPKRQTTYL